MQVHYHFGNVTTGPRDQYAEVQCTVCHSTSDECLLLLCDLCDSASHTYCVGLGGTVPEGDWFCQDCTVLRDEHARDDNDLDADSSGDADANWGNQTSLRNHQKPPSVEAPVSIHDIVREPGSHGVERLSTKRRCLSSGRVRDDGIRREEANVEHSSQAQYPAESAESGRSQLGARTLRQCRDVNGRIRALRENWDKIRQGSLSFSSITTSSHGWDEVRKRTSQPNTSSCSNQQAGPQKSSSFNNNCTQDIDKAWKMMTAAKSIENKRCTNNVICTSNALKRPVSNIRTPKESGGVRSMVLSSYKVGNKVHDGIKLGNNHRDSLKESSSVRSIALSSLAVGNKAHDGNKLVSDHRDYLVAKHNKKPGFHKYENEKLCTVPNLDYPAKHSTESSKLSKMKMAQDSVQAGVDLGNIVNLPSKSLPVTFSKKGSTCCSTGSVAENCSIAKQDFHAYFPSSNIEEESKVNKSVADGKARIESDAKSEIQSLVKLNLKLISTDKKLGMSAFSQQHLFMCFQVLNSYSTINNSNLVFMTEN